MEDTDHQKQKIWEAVVYGSISVTVVSLLSLGGAVLAPLLKTKTKYRWLHFFVAMAVATLSADAILHIIPQVVGVHGHSHGGHEEHHGEHGEHGEHHHHEDHHDDNETDIHNLEKRHADEHHGHGEEITWLTITDERRILLRLSIIVGTIFFLYFAEFVIFNRKNPAKKEVSIESCETEEEEEQNNNSAEKNSEKSETRQECGHELVSIQEDLSGDEDRRILGLKPRAFIILFGDGVHNLVDGIAIGASFLISARLGFITTIAVVCHELPHEIGDLAVLVDSGLSMCKALILNLLSALTAYIGLYLSIFLGKNEGVEIILLAITAGMFLYVAWVDMLAHLKHDVSSNDMWYVTFFVQFFGFFAGFLLIFALGWFEESFR